MRRSIVHAPALLLVVPLLTAAKPPKLPEDAPYCALPGARQIFVSPAGEPFRAAAGQPYPSAAWLAGADANHDGVVSRSELAADARRFFASLDTDHDGRLTPEEVAAYEHEIAPEIALYSARGESGLGLPASGGGGGRSFQLSRSRSNSSGESADYGGPMGAGRYAWLNVPEPVASADADVDRVVTLDEFIAAISRRFDALDPDKTGALRLATLAKTPAQVAIEGPCRPRPKPRRQGEERRDDFPLRDRDGGPRR